MSGPKSRLAVSDREFLPAFHSERLEGCLPKVKAQMPLHRQPELLTIKLQARNFIFHPILEESQIVLTMEGTTTSISVLW